MILVGVDGSRAGIEAAAWAAKEAVLHRVPLRVVNAVPRWVCSPTLSGRYAAIAAWMREGADMVLAAAADRARSEAPEVEVSTSILPGDPRAALIEAAKGARMLVVGNHGLGGFRGLLVGSVAHAVAGHAPCDVVVVREAPRQVHGEVVVGVDGSEQGGAALDFAFAEAALRGARVRAVHAWTAIDGSGGLLPEPDGDGSGGDPGEIGLVKQAIAERRRRHPDVEVVEEIVQGHPVSVLRQASTGADLLIVGSRGRGGFAGLVLGSVSQGMLHQAACPLAVIRTPQRA